MIQILFPLTITLAVETAIYMLLKWGNLKLFIVVSVMNLVLNPLMNILLGLTNNPTAYYVLLISYEIGTTLLESLIVFLFCRFKYWRTLLFAVIANGASFLLGFLLEPVFHTRITIIVLTVVFFSIYLGIEVVTLVLHTKKGTN